MSLSLSEVVDIYIQKVRPVSIYSIFHGYTITGSSGQRQPLNTMQLPSRSLRRADRDDPWKNIGPRLGLV